MFNFQLTKATSRFSRVVFSLCVLTACNFFVSNTTYAHEPDSTIIYDHACELRASADDMRDEIKTHFRGTDCYRKMLGTALQIQTRSAAVTRRTKRNPCYRGMDRDISKLNELVCELNEFYIATMLKNLRGENRKCVVGETVHVVEKLAIMTELADCMKAASLGLVSHVSNPVNVLSPAVSTPGSPTLIFPEYDPNIDVAPGVTPSSQNQLDGVRIESYRVVPGQLDHKQGTTLPSNTPTLNGPTPVYHSVIER